MTGIGRITAKAQKAISLCISMYGADNFDWVECVNLVEEHGYQWDDDKQEWITPIDGELIEHLASHMHDIWSGWMHYLFAENRGFLNADGSWVIDSSFVERWQRQMSTPYVDLPEDEKESDRIEARKVVQKIQIL